MVYDSIVHFRSEFKVTILIPFWTTVSGIKIKKWLYESIFQIMDYFTQIKVALKNWTLSEQKLLRHLKQD